MVNPEDILKFWIDEASQADWYANKPTLDALIRTRFETTWNEAMDGGLGLWLTYPSGTLAYIILTDQFSRNMFRTSHLAFASDVHARAVTKAAIKRDWDLKVDGPARQFFYLPLSHSENQCDQDRAVRLLKTRMPENENGLLHARAHREIIRQFGRFPFRNDALNRTSTASEKAWLAAGAYGETVRQMQGQLASA